MRKDYAKIIGLLLLTFALANLLVYSLTFQGAYADFIDALHVRLRGGGAMAPLIYIGLAALSVMLSPFSIVPFSIIAISIWGKLLALVYVMIGSLLGASIAYVIGAQAIHRVMKFVVPADQIRRYTEVINEKSSFLLVALFFLAMPVEVPAYVLGAGRYTYWKFILAATIAYLPFELLAIYAGDAFLHRDVVVLGTLMVLFSTLFCIAVFTLHRRIRR